MPWRALGARKATTLPIAESSSTPEWLLLRLGSREIPAVAVLRLLLGFSAGALTEETSGAIAGVTESLGPTTTVQVEGFQEEGDPFEVDILLVDWPQPLYRHLFSAGTAWPVSAIWPHAEDAMTQVLNYEQLAGAARAWVEEDLVHSEAYQTGLEDAGASPSNALMQQMLSQMQATATLVTTLQAELEVMKQDRPPPARHPPGGVATPPRTKGAGSNARVDNEEAVDGDMSTDQLLKMALVKGWCKKRSKGPGLPLSQSGSESDNEAATEDPLRKLSGAKGSLLLERLKVAMEQQPAAYITAIEALAADTLGESSPSVMTVEKYVKEELPMGHEKSLGYAAWGIARAVTMLRAGHHEKAHLILLLLLASIEQCRLDQNWGAAWKLTQLSMPPFAEWRTKDAMMSQLRADCAHTRLAHPTWCAAVIAKLRDEETLTKRRHGGAPGSHSNSQGDRPERPPRGRGRGRGTPESAEK